MEERFVLNRGSGVLHRLPASESCNTDDIKSEERFTVRAGEDLIAYIADADVRYCTRCFPYQAVWS